MNVKLEQLSKHFGSVIAVQHMNAVLKPGITGLLGANGSGKTTLLRMMVNVLPPDEGHILYGDIDIREKRRNILPISAICRSIWVCIQPFGLRNSFSIWGLSRA